MDADPAREYAARLGARTDEVERLSRRDRALSLVRIVLFAITIAVGWIACGPHRVPGWSVAIPGVLFIVAIVAHDRALQRRKRMERAAEFYRRGLERLDDKWRGKGPDGARFDDEHHPYARDLDLFGRGSLFQLICATRTQTGEERLARWLSAPAAPDEVRARQTAVADLRGRLELREELALLGDDVQSAVEPALLSKWATAPQQPMLARTRGFMPVVLALVALGAVVTLVGWLAFDWGWARLAYVAAIEAAIFRALRDPVNAVSLGIDKPGTELEVLALVLARFEREQFESPKLRALADSLKVDGRTASSEIARLARLSYLLSAQRNQFFFPFAFLLLWGPWFVYRIEAWRARAGKKVPRWLDAVGELEALCSLAGYAYEHPKDPFPELADDGPLLDGEALGHPLIVERACVRNDVRLGGELRLLLISGSNMSGKSTLLRTIGINTVLALAGAPVRAAKLRLSPLQVGATLRVQDSLEAGASRFYAEITRLRQLVDLAGKQPPLLFLLDEILAGTNSHDRRLGAEAVVRGLLQRGAIGLVTTHDLALTEMAEALAAQARNVHFEDALTDGKLQFDYRMRPGVVKHSNALELMRAVGLEV